MCAQPSMSISDETIATRRTRLIVNPSSRSGRGLNVLRRYLDDRQVPLRLEWIESRSADDWHHLIRAAQDDDIDALAIAGGDGTVTMTLNALEGCNRVPLGILPTGTGNDFARDLGISSYLPEACEVLWRGQPRYVDAGRATWLDGRITRFGCVASVGFDHEALRIVHDSGWPRSKALNFYASLRALWSYQPKRVSVSWQHGEFQGQAMFVAVSNTRGYGGGFMLSPDARIDDGVLNVYLMPRTRRLRMLREFWRVFRKGADAIPELIQVTSPWVRIDCLNERLPVAIDGEPLRHSTPVLLSAEARALGVLAPSEEVRG
jgi:diacylglycerol kinase (ATP)